MSKIAKLTVLPLVLALTAGYTTVASAAVNCDAKRSAIEFQIEQAQKYGNVYKVAGLKRALAEVNTWCTDTGLAANAQQKVTKLEKKLSEKQADVREIQNDLRAAKAKGDQKKILKLQKKVADKKADVQKIKAELQAARSELGSMKG